MEPSSTQDTDHILDQCLDALIKGTPIDECLNRYPDRAESLVPLLLVAEQVCQVPRPTLRVAARAHAYASARSAFVSQAQRRQPSRIFTPYRFVLRYALVVLLLLVVSSGTLYAADRSLPGEALYSVKRAGETVQLTITGNQSDQAFLHLTFAARRASELEQLIYLGRSIDSAALDNLFEHYTQARAVLTPNLVTVELRSMNRRILDRLHTMYAHVPLKDQPQLDATLAIVAAWESELGLATTPTPATTFTPTVPPTSSATQPVGTAQPDTQVLVPSQVPETPLPTYAPLPTRTNTPRATRTPKPLPSAGPPTAAPEQRPPVAPTTAPSSPTNVAIAPTDAAVQTSAPVASTSAGAQVSPSALPVLPTPEASTVIATQLPTAPVVATSVPPTAEATRPPAPPQLTVQPTVQPTPQPTVPQPTKSPMPSPTPAERLYGPLDRRGWEAYTWNGRCCPDRMLDADVGSVWNSGEIQQPGQSIMVDMRALRHFDGLRMDSTTSPYDYAYGFMIQVSSDGTRWSDPIASGKGTQSVITVRFAEQHARYIRVTLTAHAGPWWSINDFVVTYH